MPGFFTRKGDDGTTGLLGETRVVKHDLRMEALGSLDEASATLGLARSTVSATEIKEIILKIQKKLYLLMSEVAAEKENAEKFKHIDSENTVWIEQQIEEFSHKVSIPKEFIVPGDTLGGACLATARTIVRKGERRVSELLYNGELVNQQVLVFLNRLSSLLFVLELYENHVSGEGNQTLVK